MILLQSLVNKSLRNLISKKSHGHGQSTKLLKKRNLHYSFDIKFLMKLVFYKYSSSTELVPEPEPYPY